MSILRSNKKEERDRLTAHRGEEKEEERGGGTEKEVDYPQCKLQRLRAERGALACKARISLFAGGMRKESQTKKEGSGISSAPGSSVRGGCWLATKRREKKKLASTGTLKGLFWIGKKKKRGAMEPRGDTSRRDTRKKGGGLFQRVHYRSRSTQRGRDNKSGNAVLHT